MRGIAAVGLLIMIIAAPTATANDALRDPLCIDQDSCVGPGTCTEVGCVPRSCQPALHCSSRSATPIDQTCEDNRTIDGATCETSLGLGFRANQPGNQGMLAVTLANGSVDAFNLPNTWRSPSVDAQVELLGLDSGMISAGVYRSDITTEGPRGGPFGRLQPDDHHTWSETGLFLRHDGGPNGGAHVVVGVWTLDLVPESCFVRSSTTPAGAECQAIRELLA